MIERENQPVLPPLRPSTNDSNSWRDYWHQLGQPWRTEPEIEAERQKYLDECRNIIPDIKQGFYPFKDMKLGRADIEWLLATQEVNREPIDLDDVYQRERLGLDLRGANLCHVNLSRLPLAHIRGGLSSTELLEATQKQLDMAAVLMEGAYLRGTHLEGAHLRYAHLEKTHCNFAHLERAHLRGAYLAGASLCEAYLDEARLQNAILSDERRIGPLLADTKWGNANLSVVRWSQMEMLGDEYDARQKKYDGRVKDKSRRLAEYETSVRANRQFVIALQTQGLNEDAARFAYRAQKLQRVVLRRQRKFGSYLFSGFLDLLAGYGYRPGRSVFWYIVIIFGFAMAYYVFGHLPFFPDTFIFSLTSFHGRGFFPGLGNEASLHNPLVVLAAVEAVIGLFIEISFIATFTKRFFGS
jgi:Pentapeptide repeats (8 copies)